ncbi:MAG: hypothetical protein GXP31_10415 [Kiritimatiellaeota bacterium]|nr:hypothetical protein [Kiritimatiellota bacterium]
MPERSFGGAGKIGHSLLSRPERALVKAWVDRIPPWIETYHLTLLTLAWSAGNVFFGLLARGRHRFWFTGVSVMIVLQYLTDLFDGAVGRRRNTGLVKWGFFMDHFLDYVFLFSYVLAYALMGPAELTMQFMVLLGVTVGFMVLSFLSFAATNEFQIYFLGFGPTELRIVFILCNTIITVAGVQLLSSVLPFANAVCAAGLALLAFRTHRRLWRLDMAAKVRQARPADSAVRSDQ